MQATKETEATRATWLEQRRRYIGSSDAPVLHGYGYSSQSVYSVWANKVHGIEPEFTKADLRRMAMGKLAEPKIADFFAEDTGFETHYYEQQEIATNPDYPALSATLDAVTYHPEFGRIPLELKRVGRHNEREWYGDDGVPACPLRYQIQVAHQCLVTGAYAGICAGLIGDDDLQWRLVVVPPAFVEEHLKKCAWFWAYVTRREQPPVDGTEATRRAIEAIFPRETSGVIVDLPAESVEWTALIEELATDAKNIESRIEAAKNSIRAALGTAEAGMTPDGQVWTYKTVERSGYTVAPSASRVLRRQAAKKGKR